MRIEKPSRTTVAGLLVTIAAVVAAVEPVLPEGTPQWLRTALAIAAVVAAALLRSPLVAGDGPPKAPGGRQARRTIVLPRRDGSEP